MRKAILSAVLLLALAPQSRSADAPVKMETRVHPYGPFVVGCSFASTNGGINAPQDEAARRDSALKVFLERYGMEFPEGAFVHDESRKGRLILRNTATEQAKYRRIATAFDFDALRCQIAVDLSFVAFESAEIDRAARANASAAPSSEALIASWKAGKGRLVATKTIVTRPCINAQIQTVEEIIYPTEFSAAPAGGTNAPTTIPVFFMPGSFETREVGVVANVRPSLGADGRTIDIVIAHENSELAETNRFTATFGPVNARQRTSAEQPVFKTGKITTTVAIRDGATLVLGDIAPHGLKERYYLFLTARIVDAAGGKPGEIDTSILVDEPAKP